MTVPPPYTTEEIIARVDVSGMTSAQRKHARAKAIQEHVGVSNVVYVATGDVGDIDTRKSSTMYYTHALMAKGSKGWQAFAWTGQGAGGFSQSQIDYVSKEVGRENVQIVQVVPMTAKQAKALEKN
ncbi:hypothetical protein SEA_ANON_91 [Gordonia phage Anon]|nr:hypothetical protein SEA_ANON_91 [Gordonia phage Anon]